MKATEEVWHEYHKSLAAFIKTRVAEDEAEDILQEFFVKIHSGIGTLKTGSRLESWLYQITRNTMIDHYRSRKKTEDLPSWIEQPQPGEEEGSKKELSSCLAPMVKELPDKYRKAVLMSELENKTQKEVAEQEGLSLPGAKSRVQRGRKLLKDILYDCCQFEINRNNEIISYDKKTRDCKYC